MTSLDTGSIEPYLKQPGSPSESSESSGDDPGEQALLSEVGQRLGMSQAQIQDITRTSKRRVSEVSEEEVAQACGRALGIVDPDVIDEAQKLSRKLRSNQDWLTTLDHTRHGQQIMEHLTHIQGLSKAQGFPMESPLDQTTTFRRAMIAELKRTPNAYGLPTTMPKYIAVVNLCGRRMILYTESPVLFQLLAHAPPNVAPPVQGINGVKEVMDYQHRNPQHSLLMVYSLPFQVPMDNMHWEIRTIRRQVDGTVSDGQMCYRIGEDKASATACSALLESDVSRGELKAIVDEMASNLCAVDLDIDVDEPDTPSSGIVNKRVEVLEQLCTRLKQERKKMQLSHKDEIDKISRAHGEEMEACHFDHAESYAQDRTQEKQLREQLEKMTNERDANQAVLDAQNECLSELKADNQAATQIWEEQKDKLEAELAKIQREGGSWGKKLSELSGSHERALAKKDQVNQRTIDDMQRQVSKLQLAEREARVECEKAVTGMQALSRTMESGDAIKETLSSEIKDLKYKQRGLRVTLAVACIKHQKRCDEMMAARTQHATSESTLMGLRKELKSKERSCSQASARADKLSKEMSDAHTRAAEVMTACDALSLENENLMKERDELKQSLATGANSSTTPSTKPDMKSMETMTVPVMSQADMRLGELETQNVKLKDEILVKQNECTTLKADLARAKSKASKKAPPAGLTPDDSSGAVVGTPAGQSPGANGGYNIVTNVHVAGGGNPPATIDPGHDAQGNPNVEAIIGQVAASLRHLSDMARESDRHKCAATEGWAQVRALQQQQMWSGQAMPHGAYQFAPHGQMPGFLQQ